MPKEAGKKGMPVIGALIGGLSDAYLMSRILRGAKLIYHKRYPFEKEHRIFLLKKPREPRRKTTNTTDVANVARLPKRAKPKSEPCVKTSISQYETHRSVDQRKILAGY